MRQSKKTALVSLAKLTSDGLVRVLDHSTHRARKFRRFAACLGVAVFVILAVTFWWRLFGGGETEPVASTATESSTGFAEAAKGSAPGAKAENTTLSPGLSNGVSGAVLSGPASEQLLGHGPATLEDFPNRLINQELKSRPDFTFHRLGDGKAPVLLVVGGIQGDEPGGFSAASLLVTHYNITKGTVWVVPNLNFASIILRDRGPYGDMNRKFATLARTDPEYDIVSRIKGIILSPEVEAVLNLHDGSGFYRPQWEGPMHNPERWGQSVIIDQDVLQGHPLGELKDLADYAVDKANRMLLEPEHRYHLKNTHTGDGDVEMEKTLTYFAICNGKPAFGVEASKNVPLPVRAYYHTRVLESFMHQLGIEFVRRFELSPQGVSDALEENALIAFADNRLVLPLFNARGTLNHIPLKRGEKLEFSTASPILTLVKKNDVLEVHYGNRLLTRLIPDYHDYDESLPGLTVRVDGAEQKVAFGREVVLNKNDKFLVEKIPGYRVNVIGYMGKNDDESNQELKFKQFLPRFSLDNAGTVFRVEVYRAGKGAHSAEEYDSKDNFAGMITVRFADPAAAMQAKGGSLPGIRGQESSLGW